MRTFLDPESSPRRREAENKIKSGGYILSNVVGELCYSVRTRVKRRELETGISAELLGAKWRASIYAWIRKQLNSWYDAGYLEFQECDAVFFALDVMQLTGIDWVDALIVAQCCLHDFTLCTVDAELESICSEYLRQKEEFLQKKTGNTLKKLNLQ